ncbi:hypothetical protein GCM10009534_01410 [Kribbella sandramycini]
MMQTNEERQALAQQSGWRFREQAPELTDYWRVPPFTSHGDQRIAFGVVDGQLNGVPFVAFDFHRRPKVTHVHTAWTNKEVNQLDEVKIDTVWVVKLPRPMPYFSIASSTEPELEVEHYPEPPTPDSKFNRWYKMIDTDPNVAGYYLHPQLMQFMRKQKVNTWSVVGDDLVCMEHPIFGRTKPKDLTETLGKLVQLAGLLPYNAFPPPPPQQ